MSPPPTPRQAPGLSAVRSTEADMLQELELSESQAQSCLFVIQGLSHLVSDALEGRFDDTMRSSLLAAVLVIREQATEAMRLHDQVDALRRAVWRRQREEGGAGPPS